MSITFTTGFFNKIESWYLYLIGSHLTKQDYYKDIDSFLDVQSLTAKDEIEGYTKSQATGDHIVMDNAANLQMEVRRCVNERDIEIDVYWERWNRWLKYEHKALSTFNTNTSKRHPIIIKDEYEVQLQLVDALPGMESSYRSHFIDPVKCVNPDDGTK